MVEKNVAVASTDPGQRPYNEDRYLLDNDHNLYVVADGVGGRQAGEVASKLTCETIAQSNHAGASLHEAIQAAHTAVRSAVEARQDSQTSGMASTVVALQISDDHFQLAWAGDSRAYLWDGQSFIGLTRDHSLVEQLIARGEVNRADARNHPQKNIILSGVGGDKDSIQITCNSGDRPRLGIFLLCSDGLTDVLSHKAICDILKHGTSLSERATELTDTARDDGGRDNITVVLVECTTPNPSDMPHKAAADIYEIYDASGDALSWPDDQHGRVPTVQRVRPRTSGSDTDSSPRFPVPLPSPGESLYKRPAGRSRAVRALLIGAVLLAATLLFLFSNASS